MNPALSPKSLSSKVSEFETQVQTDSYTQWLAGKLDTARQKPLIPHDQVMVKARAVLGSKQKKHAAG